jgi:AsmA protein
MAKPLKIVLSLLGVLLALLVGAAIALPLLIDANDYREPIAKSVKDNTGRSLELGELELKVFPWIRLRVNDAVLGNAEGFGETPFAEVTTVDVGVQLLPLLFNRQLRVSTLTLEGLQVNLQRKADGLSNWDDLAGQGSGDDAPPAEDAESGGGLRLKDIDIAGIAIRGAALRYDDAQAGQSLRVEDLNLSTGRLVPGQPFDFDTAVKLSLGEPAVALALVGSARVSPDETFDRIALQGLKLHVTAGGDTLLDGKPMNLKLALSGDAVARLAAQAFEFKDLAATLETGGSDTPNGLGLQSTLRLAATTANANLSEDLASGGQKIALRGLSLQSTMAGKALIDGKDLAAKVDLSGDADVALRDLSIALLNLRLNAETGGSDTPNGLGLKARLGLAGNPLATLSTRELRWKDLALDYDLGHPEITAKGRLGADLQLQWERLIASLEGVQLTSDLGGPHFRTPGKLALQTALRYDGQAGTAEVRNLSAEALGLSLKGQLSASGLQGEQMSARGKLDVAPFNLRSLLQQLAVDLPPLEDEQALTRAALSADFEGSPTRIALRNLLLQLDESTARGSVDVRDIKTKAVRFDLAIDRLDLDRYLPPAGPEQPAPTPGSTGGGINDIALPTEVLDQLNADGSLRVGALKVSGVRLSDAQITLSSPAGQPKRQQISAKLYGGSIALDHRYTPGQKPGYALKTSLDSLNAAPFLQDLLGKDHVSGLAKLNLDLSSSGGTVGALRQALNGQLSAEVRNGAVKGFNLAQVLRRGEALLAGNVTGARAEAATTEATDFATLSVNATIVNGLLKTDSLAAASPLFRLAGGGEIDLAKETINFLAKPTVVETASGQDGKALENLRGLTIPIQLSGNLFAPKVRLDIQEALKNKALDGVRQRLDGEKAELDQKRKEEEDRLKRQAEEKITEKLGEGAVDQLRGLFGRPPRATPAPSPQTPAAPTPTAAPAAEPSEAPAPPAAATPDA